MSNESEVFALIGRIHVLLRRTLNRITDVDYMRENVEYARAMVALAEGTGNPELLQLCQRLREVMGLTESAPGGAEESPQEASKPPRKYLFTLR